ncbi:MAG TPA: 23S rRNA (uracil(1939)-C(5))-methyltransferase RlmD [Dongiaceae bacterium]|nr:23S rRNA (uracil(1939)-C(5))-methyltransferase RlmD [Dongiaceae bacterium]
MADELRLPIEKLVYGGDGLGHADGNTVFVPYVLPGETIRAGVTSRKKKLVWAKPLEILQADPQRIKPECPHFGACGGCHYQHAPYQEQVKLKTGILLETLSRMGGVNFSGPVKTHTAEPWHYRNRAQWAVRNANPRALGYYLPESNAIVPVDRCDVLSPALADAFRRLQEIARSGALPEEALEIEAFADSSDRKIALNVAFKHFPKPATELIALFRETVPALDSLLLLDQRKNDFKLSGPGYLVQEVRGYAFRVSHLSFFQVNRFLVEDLLDAVTGGAKGDVAIDLYAGVGFFTLPLAHAFQRVVSVDANESAIRNLRENAEAAGVPVVSHAVHTEEFLKTATDTPDFVVLDPPRSGLGQSAAQKLADLGPKEIAYLSCDPSTLARDLAVLLDTPRKPADVGATKHRYEIAALDFFDLFPQTYHIETLVRLRRV